MEYTTPHTSQLYGIIEGKFSVIKEEVLVMILNAKLNDTDQKMLCAKAVHTCKHVRNSMATNNSQKIPFGIFYGEKPRIIGLFSEF